MLAFDPAAAVEHLCSADRKLARLIGRVGEFTMRPQPTVSPFDMLLRAIASQQLSTKAANTIYGRVAALLPKAAGRRPASLLALSDEALRACGLSRAKVAGAKDLAAKTIEGVVPSLARLRKLPDEAVIERLTAVRGIGTWSVEMLLIFRLGRPDVLPLGDLGVRKGYMLTFGRPAMPTPQALLDHGERWRPYRSVASWYLWRALELAK